MSDCQQFDDCFEMPLPYPKIRNILFLGSSQLLVMYGNCNYTVLDIVSRDKIIQIKTGTMPQNVEQVHRLNNRSILVRMHNKISIFDVFQERVSSMYQLPISLIYSQEFICQVFGDDDEKVVLFYRSSVMRSGPRVVQYQIHQISIVNGLLQKINLHKTEYPQIRRFGYGLNQVFSYQIKGYTIQIIFLQSNLIRKIQSIYPLFVVQTNVFPQHILVQVTHQQLQGQLWSFAVSKQQVRKIGRKERAVQPHTVLSANQKRSVVYKNWFNKSKKDPSVGILRVVIQKDTRYVGLVKAVLQQVSREFTKTVIDLLSK